MSTVVLTQPSQRKYEIIEVAIGDLVKVTEWDGIVAEGIVTELTDKIIMLENGKFIEGCYSHDYVAAKDHTVFKFHLVNVASIDVAKFEKERLSFERMASQTTQLNYCGSEKIIMSQMFWNAYSKEVRSSNKVYCQYPIEVDESMTGLYVYAVPNAESLKHMVSPMNCYAAEFFMKNESGKLKMVCVSIISAFDDELESAIRSNAASVKSKIQKVENLNVDRLLYRLRHNDVVVKRGVA